MVASQAATYKN
jgi:hypothetical protein